jgi:hypothetical protein
MEMKKKIIYALKKQHTKFNMGDRVVTAKTNPGAMGIIDGVYGPESYMLGFSESGNWQVYENIVTQWGKYLDMNPRDVSLEPVYLVRFEKPRLFTSLPPKPPDFPGDDKAWRHFNMRSTVMAPESDLMTEGEYWDEIGKKITSIAEDEVKNA